MAKLTYTRTYNALDKWGGLLVERLKNKMRQLNLVASGVTVSTISHRTTRKGNILSMGIAGRKKGKWDILFILDQGRKSTSYSKAPPASAIERWMDERGVSPRGKMTKKQASFAISKGIATHGTIKRFGYRGSDVLDMTFRPAHDKMSEDLLEAYSNDVEEYIEAGLLNKPK